jgi:serine/threonine-protein kinase
MAEEQLAELMPIIVAHVDDAGRSYLQQVAARAGGAYLQVDPIPTDAVVHALEVHTPGAAPMVLLAEPLGPPTARGCPLRLRLPDAMGPASTVRASSERETLFDIGAEPAATSVLIRTLGDSFCRRTLGNGKLLIEERVGTGGAGTVYRARHRELGMSVAVKVMHEHFQADPDFCARFHAEALAASRLDHPNLTRVLDFGQEPDGLLYIAMEYLDGKSLRDILDAEKRLDVVRIGRIMLQLCSALTHAHSRGIIHRDIKPENLLIIPALDDDGNETEIVKVCDFGIAHTATGADVVCAGTPEYMAPELLRGEPPDVQSDVYACGVLLYELLSGVVPFAGELADIVPRVLSVLPDPPSWRLPGIDSRFDAIVLKALAKDRSMRYASIRELRLHLRKALESIEIFSAGGYWDDLDQGPISTVVETSEDPSDWLEHGTPCIVPSGPASFVPASAASSVPPSSRSGLEVATGPITSHGRDFPEGDPARAVAPFLRQIAELTDPVRFGALVAPLGEKIRALLQQGHASAAWRLCSTLEMIAAERSRGGGPSRAEHARTLLAIFSDRELLGPLAERALDGLRDKDGSATKLLVRAGNVGAHALYSARVKERHARFEVRERFINALREIGAGAVPTIRDALERLESRLGVPGAVAIAEDLLKAVPEVEDEALSAILVRYARTPLKVLALTATNVLPRVRGERARPVLIALIQHPEDAVSRAALKNLCKVGGVDEPLVAMLAPIALGTTPVRAPVRLAVIEALAVATLDARPSAAAILEQAFEAMLGSTPDAEELVVTMAKALIAVGGNRKLVEQRWSAASGQLRTRLEAALS